MKKILFSLILTALPFIAFAQRPTENVPEVRLHRFDRKAGIVTVEFDVLVNGDGVRNTDSWVLTPVIVVGERNMELTSVVVNGNNKRKMTARARRFGNEWWGGRRVITMNIHDNDVHALPYKVEIPFQEWMGNSVLIVNKTLFRCASRRPAPAQNLSSLAMPIRHEPQPHPSFTVPEDTRERTAAFEAYLKFPVNVSVIRPDFADNATELDLIAATFKKVKDFSGSPIRSIHLTGHASPDGPYNNNVRLARERTDALKAYIARHYDIASEKIHARYVPEDWDGLRRLVEESDMEGKSEALAIIDGPLEPDPREAALKRLNDGRTFRVMLRDMMPSLRRTVYNIGFDMSEGMVIDKESALTDPKLLSHYELFRAANEFGLDSPEAMQIYRFIERNYAGDPVARNNIAAFKIIHGDFEAAGRSLEKADTGSASTLVNMGIVDMMNGNLDNAERIFRRAADLGDPQAAANLKEIALTRQ